MFSGLLRAAVASALCALLIAGAVPPEELRAQAQGGQQNPPPATQQAPVTVPGTPPGDTKSTDQYTMSVEVPLVSLDVVVSDDRGDIYTGLKKANFRVSEDGVVQPVTNFSTPDAPITAVLIVEYSTVAYGAFTYFSRYVADVFLQTLRKDDWIALVSFDMRNRIEVDFTQDKMAVHSYLAGMISPGFRESNVFDALMDTLDNLKDVKGRKSIVLIASGIDTFSKHTLDQAYKRVKDTDVTIFSVCVARFLENAMELRGGMGRGQSMTFLQAENQMGEFAKMTGGKYFGPQFEGEFPDIMKEIAGRLRSQYSLGYMPTNQARDGKYRKIKVDVLGSDGKPVELKDQKGKNLKLIVYARQGYTAPKGPIS